MAYNLEVHTEKEMGDVVLLWVFLAVGRERERGRSFNFVRGEGW
jgi:hypothetical protein